MASALTIETQCDITSRVRLAEWSKALDLSPNLFGGVGSNPTGCTHERRRRDTGRTGKSEGRGFDSRIGLSADWTCAR